MVLVSCTGDKLAVLQELGAGAEYTADPMNTYNHPVINLASSPFAHITKLVENRLESGARKLYITGHSLGGSLATVYAAHLMQQDWPEASRVHLVTFGQLYVGDEGFIDSMRTSLPDTQYLRVVNLNDIAPRAVPFFLDNGAKMVHGGTPWFIDEQLQLTEQNIPPMANLLLCSWRKLQAAWEDLRTEHLKRQSSTRFLVRLALLPLLVINDHIDYKWALKRGPLHLKHTES
jgi:pimeloyl-ACP methyl ester carboxylesterase